MTSRTLPGFTLEHWPIALAVGAAVGAVDTVLWPLLVRVLLPVAVLTLGLGSLVLSGALTYLILSSIPGVHIRDPAVAVLVALLVSGISTVVTSLLDVDDDEFFQHRAARRARRRGGVQTDVPGVVFLQIDGLGYDVLRRAIRDGDCPTLARWVREGTHQVHLWETDWSSQTGASQIALLHGSNDDVPAFRWLEKETGRVMVSNHRADAWEIERRHSDGRGLLHADGASRGNLFTGDAHDALLTMSVAARRRGRIGTGYYGYFANPNNLARTLFATVAEVVRELAAVARLRRLDVQPRVPRGGVYPFLRAFTTVISRDVIVSAVVDDLMAGRSVIYADFLGYDEVSHHSGIENHDTLGVLRGIDRQIGRLERAVAVAPRPYRIVVLSDHGQSQGEPFATKYADSLAEVVARACSMPTPVPSSDSRPGSKGAEAWQVDALRQDRRPSPTVEIAGSRTEPVVLASGSLGMIYLPTTDRRMTRAEIDAAYPGLVDTLAHHRGIGFVLVRDGAEGVCVGARGMHHLAGAWSEGEDPLTAYGPLASRRVARVDGFAHTADLVVQSAYDPETAEVAAFEDLLGSHGGMGAQQTRAFLLRPADAPAPDGALFGAEEVHRLLRRWLASYGHEAFADDTWAARRG